VQHSDEQLQTRSLAAFQRAVLWLLRDGRDPVRLLSSFDHWVDVMLQVARSPDGAAEFTLLITYLFHVIHPLYRDALRAKVRLLRRDTKELAMRVAETIAEQFIEEGREQGLKEGIKEGLKEGIERGRVAALKNLLALKFSALDASHEALLEAASSDAIDRYLARVLFADSLAAVFAD
jgi:hypothetical protein